MGWDVSSGTAADHVQTVAFPRIPGEPRVVSLLPVPVTQIYPVLSLADLRWIEGPRSSAPHFPLNKGSRVWSQ